MKQKFDYNLSQTLKFFVTRLALNNGTKKKKLIEISVASEMESDQMHICLNSFKFRIIRSIILWEPFEEAI